MPIGNDELARVLKLRPLPARSDAAVIEVYNGVTPGKPVPVPARADATEYLFSPPAKPDPKAKDGGTPPRRD